MEWFLYNKVLIFCSDRGHLNGEVVEFSKIIRGME